MRRGRESRPRIELNLGVIESPVRPQYLKLERLPVRSAWKLAGMNSGTLERNEFRAPVATMLRRNIRGFVSSR